MKPNTANEFAGKVHVKLFGLPPIAALYELAGLGVKLVSG
jgi:hypothetical protein